MKVAVYVVDEEGADAQVYGQFLDALDGAATRVRAGTSRNLRVLLEPVPDFPDGLSCFATYGRGSTVWASVWIQRVVLDAEPVA